MSFRDEIHHVTVGAGKVEQGVEGDYGRQEQQEEDLEDAERNVGEAIEPIPQEASTPLLGEVFIVGKVGVESDPSNELLDLLHDIVVDHRKVLSQVTGLFTEARDDEEPERRQQAGEY
jgi:hypothetical protein